MSRHGWISKLSFGNFNVLGWIFYSIILANSIYFADKHAEIIKKEMEEEKFKTTDSESNDD